MSEGGRKLPRFFGKPNTARTCDHTTAPGVDACGKPAVIHVAWRLASPGRIQVGFLCAAHRSDVDQYEPFRFHDLGSCCGMPGSIWDTDRNRCLYPEGLPVLEESRRELAPA